MTSDSLSFRAQRGISLSVELEGKAVATIGQTLTGTRPARLRTMMRKEGALKLRGEVLLALDTLKKNPLRSALTILRIVMPQFGSGTADVRRGVYRAKNVILQGNSPSIGQIFDMKIEFGRMFNETDAEHRMPVVLLGYDTARILFPESPSDSIGKEVTINGQLFTVIGTAEKRKQGISGGSNPEDNIAMMPVTTLRKLYPNQKDYVIFAKAKDPNNVGEAVEEMRDLLRRKRRLPNNKPDDFAL